MPNIINITRLLNEAELQQIELLSTEQHFILLSQDGVYNSSKLANITFNAISSDVESRGLQKQFKGIDLISYADFVELTLSYQSVLKW